MPSTAPKLITASILAFSLLTSLTQAHAQDLVIGSDKYELLEKMPLANGEILLRVKSKSVTSSNANTPATVPAGNPAPSPAPSPVANASTDKTAKTDTTKAADDISAAIPKFIKQEDAIMDSSGLSLLGVTAADINRPSTPHDLLMAVARGVDASGKLNEGMGIEFAPLPLLAPGLITGGAPYTYDSNWFNRAATRTSIGLATAKSEDAKIGNQLAASIRIGLIDGSDPRLLWKGLDNCADYLIKRNPFSVSPGEIKRQEPGSTPTPDPNSPDEITAKNIDTCYKSLKEYKDLDKDRWKQPAWYAGFAKAWYTGSTGQIQDALPGAKVLWTSYSRGWGNGDDKKQLLQLYAAKKWDDRIKDPKDANKFSTETRTDIVARYKLGRGKWHAFIDGGVARVDTAGVATQNIRRLGYGAEYQFSDNMWLLIGSISERGYVSGDGKRSLLNTGIRFGQSDVPVIFSQPKADAK
ncbi:hypothetical protein H8L32_11500 [Undibacterium sp. CY18W]|uniref:Uncharacterized protein n=1 Tax=Undibacterium hunanense TaxID=2762292 RepID=A0ABR6ZR72_9BURK|nr:hypothetical protein [Undibacterium hunanense]MBC3918104.1 hypothetical protein [Undibacterium hunanense]